MPATTAGVLPVENGSGVTAGDLAELMASFSEVTTKLETTHQHLKEEVARLNEELREKDEQLSRSRRLAALGEMAAGIAHEIRNPLGSIGLYAGMLVDDLPEGKAPRATAEKIAGGVRRLDEIVCDVLAFSRELRVRPAPCEVEALFDDALEACFGPRDRREGGLPGVAREDGGAPEIVCDAALVQQALVNLIRNASEATADRGAGGGLTLGARIEPGCGKRRRGAVLWVRDTGPGIEASVIDRMFNPFFTTRETGTGLGLAIVHRIVDAHGGRVEVFNNADRGGGAGATVELHLPQPAAGRNGSVGQGGNNRERTESPE